MTLAVIRECLRSTALSVFVVSPLLAEPAAALPVPEVVSLPRVVASFENPVLEPQGREFKDWTFTQGHCSYTLSGVATNLLVDGQVVGFCFTGRGAFHYISAFAYEHPVLKYNADQNGWAKVHPCPEGLAVDQRVDDAVFWFAATPVPALPGSVKPAPLKDFAVILKACKDEDLNALSHDLAMRRIGSTSKPYFKAQLRCGANLWPFVHEIDGLDSERLMVRKPRLFEAIFQKPWVQLSRQMEGWDYRHPRNPRIVLTNVELDLTAPKQGSPTLKVTETFRPMEDGLQAIDLELYSYRAESNASGAWVKNSIQLLAVRDAQGQALEFDHRDHRVMVSVPNLKAQVPVTLSFEMTGGVVPERRMKDTWWALDNGPWFPLPEEWSARAFTFHAKVRIADPYVPIMSGETVQRLHEAGMTQLETKVDNPVQTFGLMAGIWTFKEEVRNGVTLRVVAPDLSSMTCKEYTDSVDYYLRYFKQLIGPYPFKELNVVPYARIADSPAILGSGITKQSPDPGPVPNIPTGYAISVAEHLLRQYWGQIVQVWGPEDLWITEGFSEYLSNLAMLSIPSLGPSWFKTKKSYWADSGAQGAELAPIGLACQLAPKDDNWRGRYLSTRLLNHKGAVLVAAIHQELGDDNFVKFLQTFQASLRWHSCQASQVPDLVQKTTGKDIAPLMERAYWGMAMPQKKN